MGKSSLDMIQKNSFTERQLDHIIEMACEDRTPFEGVNYKLVVVRN